MHSKIAGAGFAALLLLSLAASASAQGTDPGRIHTQSGEDLGAINLKDISEADSGVRFVDAADVKQRQAQTLRDRRVEVLLLRNNAVIVFTKVMYRTTFGAANFDPAPNALKYVAGTKFLVDQGFVLDETKVRRAGIVAYEAQTTKTAHCFVYTAFLGDGIELTREVHGYVCYRLTDRTVEEVEREMVVLLAHARFAKSSDASDFSVTLGIPAARIVERPLTLPESSAALN